ncbi:hypothetical protein PLESTB_000576800 [Pleodorina starrii]|uniref:RING-type domain-containing protein n=1 Tax=Pleodorina starrii TaxID=330485 RepID=A0A9W6F0V1_9CHLO|nr:hypothetical protein PLESTM_000308100 [Pleodorina starrii]GLC52049.1 hypothetical protein PLESTB_000576800 [Pleodorina starrii]GLC72190.1 hypothetical protein PLESTF_001216700 [Pleodorina starrii]
MPNPKPKTKTSLANLLAQHPEPPRNDWSHGRPGGPSNERRDDGFPEYDPKAFESGEEEEDDEGPGTGAGGAFAILAGMNGDPEASDDEWVTVAPKQKKKGPTPAPAPAAAASSAAPRRAAAPSAPAPRPVPAALPRPIGALAGGLGAAAGPSRAPYNILQANAASPRAPRPQTHDAEGRPISDTYYQTFQKVHKNAGGNVCMRFHKTDVVVVRPNGDVQLTSGGFRTRTTFLTVAEALQPLGFTLTSSLGGEGRGEWAVTAPDGSCTAWEDEMVIAATSEADRVRGARLLSAYGAGTGSAVAVAPTRAPPTGHAAAAAAAGTSGAAAPRAPIALPGPAPAPAPTPGPAPVPGSTWSYRSIAGAPAPVPAAAAAAAAPAPYIPHLRPPGAFGAPPVPITVPAPVPVPVPVPTPRTAESLSELQQVLDAALALRDEATGRGSGGGGAAAAAAAGGAGAAGAAPPAALPPPAAALPPAPGAGAPDLDDDHACIACMAALKTTLLIPCGHLVMCGPCAAQVLDRSGVCPMCRVEVVSHVDVRTDF